MPRTALSSKQGALSQCQELAATCELIVQTRQHILTLRDMNLLKKLAFQLRQENALDKLNQLPYHFAALKQYHQNILNEIAKIQRRYLNQAGQVTSYPAKILS